jgi:sulfate transport system substrate-binding protein
MQKTALLIRFRAVFGADVQVIVPLMSILAAPPVTVVDKVVDRRGTRKVAEAYLQFLYTKQGQ